MIHPCVCGQLLAPMWLKASASATGILPGIESLFSCGQISPLSIHSILIKWLSLLSYPDLSLYPSIQALEYQHEPMVSSGDPWGPRLAIFKGYVFSNLFCMDHQLHSFRQTCELRKHNIDMIEIMHLCFWLKSWAGLTVSAIT